MPRPPSVEPIERKLNYPEFILTRYFIAFLNGDGEDMGRKATRWRGERSTEDMISHLEALVLARSVGWRKPDARPRLPSTSRSSPASASGQRCSARQRRCGRRFTAMEPQRDRGSPRSSSSPGAEVDYAAAFALAVAGDVRGSRALAEDLARDYPEDTSVQFMYLPTLRALFSLDARDAAEAIQSLQTASRFDLALGGLGFNGFSARSIRRTFVARRTCGASARSGCRRVSADCRSSKHRPRRSHGRPGAPAAGTSTSSSRATPRRQKALTTICLRFGRTPTQTFGLSKKHGLSTPGCREAAYPYATSHDSLTALATRPDREWRMNAGTTSTSCCSPRSIFPRQSATFFSAMHMRRR